MKFPFAIFLLLLTPMAVGQQPRSVTPDDNIICTGDCMTHVAHAPIVNKWVNPPELQRQLDNQSQLISRILALLDAEGKLNDALAQRVIDLQEQVRQLAAKLEDKQADIEQEVSKRLCADGNQQYCDAVEHEH